jgi:Na+-translocating ferredoxin:NAD+ oxidoreductase subunit E
MQKQDKEKPFMDGLLKNNPVLVLMLGLCPSLAVTTSIENGLGMGISALFVLFFSNLIISLLKGIIPEKIRIPSYIVIIATFVTVASMILQAYFPKVFESLGVYVPLIVVNCIILGRAEAYARKNTVRRSILDGFGMGLGFTIALCIIGGVREILGTGAITFLQNTIFAFPIEPIVTMILPPGALLTIGLIIAGKNMIFTKKESGKVE